jgi:hypothetical protein
MTKQIERTQGGAVPADTRCATIDAAKRQIEELRDLLAAEGADKMKVQERADKLDDENLRMSFEQENTEVELIETKHELSTLKDSTEASMQQLRILRKVVDRANAGQDVSSTETAELLDLVSRTVEENQGLVEATARIQYKHDKLQTSGKTIEDKCDTDVRKSKDEADFWWHLYFNEAVPTTECLHKELAALKAEKASSTLLRRYHHRIRKYLSESCSRSSVALDWKAYLKS